MRYGVARGLCSSGAPTQRLGQPDRLDASQLSSRSFCRGVNSVAAAVTSRGVVFLLNNNQLPCCRLERRDKNLATITVISTGASGAVSRTGSSQRHCLQEYMAVEYQDQLHWSDAQICDHWGCCRSSSNNMQANESSHRLLSHGQNGDIAQASKRHAPSGPDSCSYDETQPNSEIWPLRNRFSYHCYDLTN